MPLRDHYHPSATRRRESGTQLNSMWPTMLAVRLETVLPKRYTVEPSVRLGTAYELDVAGLDKQPGWPPAGGGDGGVTVAPAPASAATFTLDAALGDPDEFELQVFDTEDGWRLVASVEIVSRKNKDRPDTRATFVAKCAELLRQGIAVSIVDVVTSRHANLYADLTAEFGRPDPAVTDCHLYVASVRGLRQPEHKRFRLESWAYPLTLGQPIPSIPLWVGETERYDLPLEESYEDVCRILRLPPP